MLLLSVVQTVMQKVHAFMEQGQAPFALHRFRKLASEVSGRKSAGYEPKKVNIATFSCQYAVFVTPAPGASFRLILKYLSNL